MSRVPGGLSWAATPDPERPSLRVRRPANLYCQFRCDIFSYTNSRNAYSRPCQEVNQSPSKQKTMSFGNSTMATTKRSPLCDPEAPLRYKRVSCEEETIRMLCGVSRLDSSTSHAVPTLHKSSPNLSDSAQAPSISDIEFTSTTLDEGHLSGHPSFDFSSSTDHGPDTRTCLTDLIIDAIADGSLGDESLLSANTSVSYRP